MVRTQKCCGCLSGANLTTSGDCPDRTFKAVTGPRQNRINHGHGRHSNKSEKSVSQTPPKCPRRRLCEKVTRRSQEGREGLQKLPKRSQKVTGRSRRLPKASREVTRSSQEGHEGLQELPKRSREGHKKVTKASKSFQRGHKKVTGRSRGLPKSFQRGHFMALLGVTC
jgi:hypothetical protein